MYITLQSIKRNLGLFNLELEDIIIGSIFGLIFTILFLLHLYTLAIIVISIGVLALIPMDFSKCNRMYNYLVYLQSLCLKIEITIFIKTKVRGSVFINKLLDKIKEYKNKKIEKRINKIKKNKKDIYLSKGILKKKVQNSQCFTNIKDISDNGIITLKNGGYALMYSACLLYTSPSPRD